MYEILTKWGASEWAGIIQAGGAIISSIFLFYTFNSQKDSAEIARKSAELDRKAKRAEYLPEIETSINVFEPVRQLPDGSFVQNGFNGEITKVIVKIKFDKNPVQILDYDFDKTEKYIQKEFYPFPFDQNKILLPGEYFEVTFGINLLTYFDLDKDSNHPQFSQITEANGIDYRGKIYLRNRLIFADMLGNKYQFQFDIINLNAIHITELKMID
ncbi:hypothetical protein [Sphingobacterium multivorum]|uniref:hypothetical protein n=1 Tax=Sphingobacterium multivorum TaxID=28454 RepID=UPI003DA436EF